MMVQFTKSVVNMFIIFTCLIDSVSSGKLSQDIIIVTEYRYYEIILQLKNRVSRNSSTFLIGFLGFR